jgi:hypothetical protein
VYVVETTQWKCPIRNAKDSIPTKKEEEEEDGEKLHHEEIRNLNPSPNICTICTIIKPRMAWAGRSSRVRNACKIFVEKRHGSKPREISWCISTVDKFSKNQGDISKLWAPEGWHEARSTLNTQKYYGPPYRI